MKRFVIFISVFLMASLMFAGLSWLGGYDFDSRGVGVALTTFYLGVFAAGVALIAAQDFGD